MFTEQDVYIKRFYIKDEIKYVEVDYIEETSCANTEQRNPCFKNNNTLLRSFEINPTATGVFFNQPNKPLACDIDNISVYFDKERSQMSQSNKVCYDNWNWLNSQNPYRITIINNQIREIKVWYME